MCCRLTLAPIHGIRDLKSTVSFLWPIKCFQFGPSSTCVILQSKQTGSTVQLKGMIQTTSRVGHPDMFSLGCTSMVYSLLLEQFVGKSVKLHTSIVEVTCSALALSSRTILLLPEPGLSWHGNIFFRGKKKGGWGKAKKKTMKRHKITYLGKVILIAVVSETSV